MSVLDYLNLAKGELRGLFYTETEAQTKPPKVLLAMNDDETVKGIMRALDYLETATGIDSLQRLRKKIIKDRLKRLKKSAKSKGEP